MTEASPLSPSLLSTALGVSLALAAAVASAAPGDLDSSYHPLLTSSPLPGPVSVTPQGRLLTGSGSADRLAGTSIGSEILLSPDGSTFGEPLPGWLNPNGIAAWFSLSETLFLIQSEDGRWVRYDATAQTSADAFPDLLADESIQPQFLCNGRLWVIRSLADGSRRLEKRQLSDGSVDPSFSQAANWPDQPSMVVPGPGETLWVLGGERPLFAPLEDDTPLNNVVFQVDGSGQRIAAVPAVILNAYQSPLLRAGANGGFTIQTGTDLHTFNFWPAPEFGFAAITRYDAAAVKIRSQTFTWRLGTPFSWAEDAQGRLLATSYWGELNRYLADGTLDASFHSPGKVRALLSLPDGKWLVDGARRLLPDGLPDPGWTVPDFTAPATVSLLAKLPDGRVLAGGDFTRAGGQARHQLTLFQADGSVDPGFSPDPRATDPVSIAASGDFIYAVCRTPVRLSDGRLTNLIKLTLSGALDETFFPSPNVLPSSISDSWVRVAPGASGQIVAQSVTYMEVYQSTWVRLNSTGNLKALYQGLDPFSPHDWLTLANGEAIIGDTWFAADQTDNTPLLTPRAVVLRQLGAGRPLRPVCEWQGGVLFSEDLGESGDKQRLRLWKNGRWAADFATPPLDHGSLLASPGEANSLYLTGSGQGLRRMLPHGAPDPAFHAAPLSSLLRREPGPWKTLVNGQISPLAIPAEEQGVTALLSDATGSRIWIGGSFNRVAGQDRDGLAWLEGGGVSTLNGPANAWAGWQLGMGLNDPSGTGDPDGDGIPNALEFLYGSDPYQASSGPTFSRDDQNLIFEYDFSTEARDFPPVVEFSQDLIHWTTATPANATLTSTPLSADLTHLRIAIPVAGRDHLLVRLRATLP